MQIAPELTASPKAESEAGFSNFVHPPSPSPVAAEYKPAAGFEIRTEAQGFLGALGCSAVAAEAAEYLKSQQLQSV